MPEIHVVPDAISSENVDRVFARAAHEWRAQRAETRRLLHLSSRRLFRFEGFTGFCKAVVLACTFILFVLIAGGKQQENAEFTVLLKSCDAGVLARTKNLHKPAPATANALLSASDGLQTPPSGEAVLSFADGSAVQIGKQTRLDIARLDFSRDGRRDRTAFLHAGRAFVRVSPYFGPSRSLLATPSGLVSAAGDSSYEIVYNPKTGQGEIQAVTGVISVRNAGGTKTLVPGMRMAWTNTNAPPFLLSQVTHFLGSPKRKDRGSDDPKRAAQFAALQTKNKHLKALDAPKPLFYQIAIRFVMKQLDPALQKAGMTTHGFSLADNDAARAAQAAAQLKRLGEALATGENGDAPAQLNPVTLAPLPLAENEKNAILSAFCGATIDDYKKQGSDYVLRVRARDRVGTRYELTSAGVRALP